MKYAKLGNSELDVSRVCLGSMTWGIQNNLQEATEQIDYALDNGVNFIDTAEMYPVPPAEDTYGATERIIGEYFARSKNKRSDTIVATKIAGAGLKYIRQGSMISGETITVALEASLQRLQTDYIDVYQLHWPNRFSPHFGKHWPNQIMSTKQNAVKERERMRDIVTALGKAISAGKIRHWGLSDDTPWGIHTYLSLCEELGVPKPVSIQNEFNLLHAKDWPYLIESCVFENIAYLPWSPLAGGLLSGKYLDGARPKGSRYTLSQRQGLFRDTSNCDSAVRGYCDVAKKYGITPSQLALAWCDQIDGVTSTIIGATSMAQLIEDMDAFSIDLSADCLEEISQLFKQYPIPF